MITLREINRENLNRRETERNSGRCDNKPTFSDILAHG